MLQNYAACFVSLSLKRGDTLHINLSCFQHNFTFWATSQKILGNITLVSDEITLDEMILG